VIVDAKVNKENVGFVVYLFFLLGLKVFSWVSTWGDLD